MSPKEKAKWLVETYFHIPDIDTPKAKILATIAVNVILDSCTWKKSTFEKWGLQDVHPEATTEYWMEVKEEIKNI